MTRNRQSFAESTDRYDRRFVLRMTAGGGITAAGIVAGSGLRSQAHAQEATPVVAASPVAGQQFAYVGADSRTAIENGADPETTGISVFAVDPDTGALSLVQTVKSDNPFFFAFDPTKTFLYGVNVIADYEGDSGIVEAYAVDPATGELTFINRQASGGGAACHLSVDPSGRYVVVANYSGGSFTVLPINDDGSLEPVISTVSPEGSGPNEARQEMSHPHAVTYDPAGNFIAGADLGVDKVFIFRLNLDSGELEQVSEASTAPGAGPRHVAFNEEGTLLYVLGELDGTITLFAYDSATGAIGEQIQVISTVPDPFEGTKSTAEIFIHPSGQFLYNSNRGQPDSTTPEGDAIVAFSIDPDTGELSLIGHMMEDIAEPQSFGFDTTGTWLYAANYRGDSVTQYEINQETGELTNLGMSVETPWPFVIVMSKP
jgi:6-phosphogluconolactonase (cycloisomerase 2 family)